MSDGNDVRVFISYSHDSQEHKQRVLDLANKLREQGVDVCIDSHIADPMQGWQDWMLAGIDKAKFVLIVCTESYCRRFEKRETPGKGHGAIWEGSIIKQRLYESGLKNEKFIPVFFDDVQGIIPTVLRQFTCYQLPNGYVDLYRRLTDQPACVPPPIGKRLVLPPATIVLVSNNDDSLREALEAGIRTTIGELETSVTLETLSRMNQSPREKYLAFRTGLYGFRSQLPAYQEKLIDLHIKFGVSDPSVIATRIQQDIHVALTRTMESLAAGFRGQEQAAARRDGHNIVAELLTVLCSTADKAGITAQRQSMSGGQGSKQQ